MPVRPREDATRCCNAIMTVGAIASHRGIYVLPAASCLGAVLIELCRVSVPRCVDRLSASPRRRGSAAIGCTYRGRFSGSPVPYLVAVGVVAQGLGSGSSTRQISGHTAGGLTALGFGVPIAAYVWFLHHYSLNVVRSDQWADVTLIAKSYDGQLTLSALWAQHAENRILFPNLIALAMSRVDAFNISVEEYISASLLFAAIALIIVAHKRPSPDRPWIAYCPVAILMASIVQAENTLWGFQLAWYLVLVLLAGVIFILDRPSLSMLENTGAMILAVIGSYSSLQGLFIWVAGLLLLLYRRRPTVLIVEWVAAGTLTTALYVYKFEHPGRGALVPHCDSSPTPSSAFLFRINRRRAGSPAANERCECRSRNRSRYCDCCSRFLDPVARSSRPRSTPQLPWAWRSSCSDSSSPSPRRGGEHMVVQPPRRHPGTPRTTS